MQAIKLCLFRSLISTLVWNFSSPVVGATSVCCLMSKHWFYLTLWKLLQVKQTSVYSVVSWGYLWKTLFKETSCDSSEICLMSMFSSLDGSCRSYDFDSITFSHHKLLLRRPWMGGIFIEAMYITGNSLISVQFSS